jgi:UDP-N-acetyl-D-mannosaminuronate dehydrogenase
MSRHQTFVVGENTAFQAIVWELSRLLPRYRGSPNSPKRRMRAGINFHLAFSPEREDPGNQQITLSEVRAAAATISTHFVLHSGNCFE